MNCASHPKNRTNESGNVLFYILIAVALIAALSYAVSNSSRGSLSQLDGEKARLAAIEIMEYADVLAKATAQLRLRGCADNELSYENSVTTTDYANTANPTGDNTCHIFHVSGGGVQYRNPDGSWLDNTKNTESFFGEYLFTARTCIPFVGAGELSCQGEGSSSAELIFVAPFIEKEICIEINNRLNIGIADADPPQDAAAAWVSISPAFKGVFPNGVQLRDPTDEYLLGKTSGCFEADSAPNGGYHFYKVLVSH